jgi:hypothetical protein
VPTSSITSLIFRLNMYSQIELLSIVAVIDSVADQMAVRQD